MVNTRDIYTDGSARSHTQPGNCLRIYYQKVRGLRTKQLELHEHFCSIEIWLNALFYDHNLFLDFYTVLRSDRASVNKTRGVGVLIALSCRVLSRKRRYDLESCDECAWVGSPNSDGLCSLETITFP
jgi:hypothetical protein